MTSYNDAYKPRELPQRSQKKCDTRYEPKEIPFDPNTYAKVGYFSSNKNNVGVYRTWGEIAPEIKQEEKQEKKREEKKQELPLENNHIYEKNYQIINNTISPTLCPVQSLKQGKIRKYNF